MRWIVAALTVGVVGCTPSAWVAKFVPPATDRFARTFIDTLTNAPPRSAMRYLIPQLATNDAFVDTLGMMQRVLPRGRIDSVLIAGAVVRSQDGSTQRIVAYQIRAGGKWGLIRLVMNDGNSDDSIPEQVAGLTVWSLGTSLQSMNALTLQHASTGGLIAALLALLNIAASVYAAVQVIRSPLKHRWWWVIVSLIGFGKIAVAWQTGAVTQQWLAVQFLGAGMVRDGWYGPWWVTFSIPGGAFIALDRRRRAIAAVKPVDASPRDSEPLRPTY